MNKISHSRRLLESKKYFLLFWIFFTLLFFAFFFFYKSWVPSGTSSIYEYLRKYGIYVPLAIGALSIVKSYVLLFITYVLRINFFITKIVIYFLIYGFWLTLGVQLRYFEPRYTDIAIVLIDTYSLPLLLASGITLSGVFLFSFFKKKSVDTK